MFDMAITFRLASRSSSKVVLDPLYSVIVKHKMNALLSDFLGMLNIHLSLSLRNVVEILMFSQLTTRSSQFSRPSVRPGRRWRGSNSLQKGPCRSQGGLASHCAIGAPCKCLEDRVKNILSTTKFEALTKRKVL
ncbi:hypothetical protein PoB_006567500 [Plakobranchus ocellatus]|uniref:Uncharacterized protein n=1 Tax=Plakobranchus ocellatus TaxID=259542 RepID=A0AAV4D512_9GAST|nr:hypothetical protein PoB_006567500 [Plakobranchus ocellatus]